jgi:hypothetical protein
MSRKRIIRSGDYMHRPAWFRAANRVMSMGIPGKHESRLNKDDLIQAARRITGLYDFGREFWEEPLERLLISMNEEARLHPIGFFISRLRIINLLSTRLRAEFWFKKYPEILEQELYPVIVIVGLQRTGTTKLQRLLSADPDNRVLKSWEAINPAPIQHNRNRVDKRIKIARTSERTLRYIAPGFFAIHPVEHDAPEEDILLLDVTFLSTTPEATMHVPSYAGWLENIDQSYAYDYAIKLLKLLQWQKPASRWVLKSPHHMEFLDIVDKKMGNVHYIWAHRDITRCIPSFLSMVSHSRIIFSDHVEIKDVVDHWVRKTNYMLLKGLEFRNLPGNNQKFTDIFYKNLVENSIDEIHRIYERYGGINNGFINRFSTAEKNNPQWKYGIHEYDISDFKISKDDLFALNRAYVEFSNQLK